jgi:hypothetical protein
MDLSWDERRITLSARYNHQDFIPDFVDLDCHPGLKSVYYVLEVSFQKAKLPLFERHL